MSGKHSNYKIRREIANPGCAKSVLGRLCQRRESTNHMGLFPRSGFCASENGNHVFTTMEGEACSFQEIVDGKCGFSSKDKEKSVKLIPLLNCTSNVDRRKSALAFTEVQNEVELILARARLFHFRKTLINSRYVLNIGRHLVLAGNATQLVAMSRLYCPHTVRKLRIGREWRGGSLN